jgi:hypothetical protein
MKMKNKHIFLLITLLVFTSNFVFAQSQDATKPRVHKFVIYGGVGPNNYFNNLVIAKDYVNEINYSAVIRIMWEPKFNLRLGIESGYNRLYSISEEVSNKGSLDIVNSAIPIMFVVEMKFFDNFYANFLYGQSILQNKVSTSDYGDFNASNISLGDFSGGIGYRKLLNDRVVLGAELKYYLSAKLQDSNMALIFMAGYRL